MYHFSALEGFSSHPYYDDFSIPCFDGQHQVMIGCNFMSTGNEASVFSRTNFRPHYFQHASFRLVDQNPNDTITSDTDAPGPYVGDYPYRVSKSRRNTLESDLLLEKKNSSLSYHFGAIPKSSHIPDVCKSPTKAFRDAVDSILRRTNVSLEDCNVLEIGCGFGGLTLSLAPDCKSIVGTDHDEVRLSNL